MLSLLIHRFLNIWIGSTALAIATATRSTGVSGMLTCTPLSKCAGVVSPCHSSGIREASTPISTVTRLVHIPTRSVYSGPFVQVRSMCFHDDYCLDWDMRESECSSNLHEYDGQCSHWPAVPFLRHSLHCFHCGAAGTLVVPNPSSYPVQYGQGLFQKGGCYGSSQTWYFLYPQCTQLYPEMSAVTLPLPFSIIKVPLGFPRIMP